MNNETKKTKIALRGRRPLRGVWTLRAALPLVGTTFVREYRERHAKPYTRHEVTARRAGAPSGRTYAAS